MTAKRKIVMTTHLKIIEVASSLVIEALNAWTIGMMHKIIQIINNMLHAICLPSLVSNSILICRSISRNPFNTITIQLSLKVRSVITSKIA